MGDLEMSRVNPYKCPVSDCKIHHKVIYSEEGHFKRHLRDHDYTELLETAVSFHLINSITDRRSPMWLIEHLAIVGLVREELVETGK